MADPGIETSTFAGAGGAPDLDTLGNALSDTDALLEDMLRAVTEQEGVLYWAPDQTLNLGDYLEKGMTAAMRMALEARIASLFEDDPRYASMVARVTLAGNLLSVTMDAVSTSGITAQLQLQQDGVTLKLVRV